MWDLGRTRGLVSGSELTSVGLSAHALAGIRIEELNGF